MKTWSRLVCWPLVWIVLMGCTPFPEHDNPADPDNPDYRPYDGSVRMESVQGGDCKAGDSCVVVAVLEVREGAPDVDAVWVQICGSEKPSDFATMTEESQQKWVHRFAEQGAGLFELLPETPREGRDLDSQPPSEKSGRDLPCWFVVRDVECKYYLIGPVSVGR